MQIKSVTPYAFHFADSISTLFLKQFPWSTILLPICLILEVWQYGITRLCCINRVETILGHLFCLHYYDIIMSAVSSQITSLTIVYSIVYSDADQRKHQSSASLAFVWGLHRGPVNSPHKWRVTWKMLPFDDVIMDLMVDGCIMTNLCKNN